jgi:small-conductance mechanosensitive channel/CRP-like cAMP-binding protein
MRPIPETLLSLLWALLLYAALTLLQRFFLKRVTILRHMPIALNILFLLLSVNLFLWKALSKLHADAANWNRAALLFMSVYLAIRLLDYWVFELILPRRKKTPVPIVLRDICRWLLSTVALFVIIRSLFPDVNLNVLAFSSIVVGYILGNATQDTLGNLVSGLALNTEDPFTIGDWVTIAGHTGRIMDMTWRATCLRTKMDDFITIPNAAIAREAIVNYSRPTVVHGYTLNIGVNYEVSPGNVRATLMDVLRAVPQVLQTPSPTVRLEKFNDFSIDYIIKFYSRDFEQLETIQTQIMDLIWYHFKRNGIVIPFPIRDVNMRQITRDEESLRASEQLSERTALLAGISLFGPLSHEDRQTLAAALRKEIYAPGEAIIRQGKEGSTFYILKSGEADVSTRIGTRTVNIAHLTPGSFFGEMSFLTGEKRSATVTARIDCVVFALSHTVLSAILESNSQLAEELAFMLEKRQKEAEGQAKAASIPAAITPAPVPSSILLSRIRRFFSLDEI